MGARKDLMRINAIGTRRSAGLTPAHTGCFVTKAGSRRVSCGLPGG